jgi:amino acid adenylation domain-containing protein
MTSTQDPTPAPSQPTARQRLDSLSPQQRHRLEQLARSRHRAAAASLHAGFEAWAARCPQAVAVSCGDRHIRYGELDAQADALARRLVHAGVAPGMLVAITLDRGIELVVALLAVLKAGAAYLPIDPAVPEERQRLIREDAGARLTLAQSKYRALLAGCGGEQWFLDEPAPQATAAEAARPLPPVAGGDLAYVIYTSGSTGRPKGVMVEHRHVVRLFTAAEQHFGFSQRDVWSLFHSYAFDFSVWEIWGALLYGARLVIVPHAVARSAPDMAALLLAEGVTVLNQTPTAFSNLMGELLARGSAGALRYVVFGGEALEPRRLARWFERFGDQAPVLVNMYGITETTVHVTYKRLHAQDAQAGISDIGAPLADLSLHVLNERRQPVPQGVVGELYVGGAGVSRGYLNRPELTAERFIASPFVAGERLYRTGDLARRLEGGALEYIGRNDDQVKLRGFRIELGDIERQLVAHAAVHDAVVALQGEGDERRLVAYVVLAAGAGDGWQPPLHRHLAAALPGYMVPAGVVALAALPLTDNGKIDRAALPAATAADVWQHAYAAPRTPEERRLCELVAGLLQLQRVGIHDNFFALGGDSLKTVNLVAAARSAGLHFSIADVFAHPCLADLAQAAAAPAAGGGAGQGTGPFELIQAADRARLPAGVEAAYPMSRLQQGMVYHNLASGDNSLYHNVISQRFQGRLDIGRMRAALARLMAAHEVLRTSFHLEGFSVPLQLVHSEVEPPLAVTDLRALPPQAQAREVAGAVARLRAQRLDLATAPLFQAHLFQVADTELELIWLEHHAILDGWSLASFMTQLMAEYSAAEQGRGTGWQPPSSRYREFIAAEQHAIADAGQAAFWAAHIGEAPETRLQGDSHAADGSGGPADEAARQIEPVQIAPERFARCRELAAELGVPLKSVFLAAYARVVGKFSGEVDLTVGLTTHGRPEAHDCDDLVGLYVSMHPLRLSCGRATWRELVRHCHQAEAQVWAHRFYPLSEIKRLHADRELFETSFTYNHFSVTAQARDIGLRAMRGRRAFEHNETGLGVAFAVMDMKADRCQVDVAFDSGRFSAGYARRFQAYLLLALERMTREPDERADVLDDADACLAASLAQPLVSVAATDHLSAQWEVLVHSHAQEPALEQGGQVLTYAELDRRASHLAVRLRQRGVGAGELVGFDAVPSPDMVAALLAVFKLGAVFVPLDPEQSGPRLRAIVQESGLTHIVADSGRWAGTLPAHVHVHDLARLAGHDAPADPAAARGAAAAGDAREPGLPAERLAYVIYTSGSTGRPKGVAITHGNAVSYLHAIRVAYGLRSGERLLQVSNIGFDIFIEELLASLFSGNTMVLRPTPRLPDATEFWQLVAQQRIHLVHLATAYWNLLCAELPEAAAGLAGRLRLCVVGGEAMQRALADRWLARLGPGPALINSYGPTETTVAATMFDASMLARSPGSHAGVPIGRPLPNCACWVLGKDLLPAPHGVAGELHIGGPAVSPGYLGQPHETQQKFLEAGALQPHSPRVYRTGDRVRLLPDGQIEFVGRTDGQVKIRGHRVEPDEVRHAIAQDPAVKQCLVVAARHGGDNRLAAYLVLAGPPAEQPQALAGVIQRAAARLPGYMRPGAWVPLPALPMTPNRKIDVKALPAPDFEPAAACAAPATPTEAEVQALWGAALGREHIGVDADFFAAGGHSLLLTRLLLRISQAFGVALDMAELMRARTIRDMAALVDAAQSLRHAAESAPAAVTEDLEW